MTKNVDQKRVRTALERVLALRNEGSDAVRLEDVEGVFRELFPFVDEAYGSDDGDWDDPFWSDLFAKVAGKVAIRHRPHYRLLLERDKRDDGGRWYFQVEVERPDVNTGEPGVGRSGKGYLSPSQTESELVQMALGMFLGYDAHEIREAFEYEGVNLFHPHIDVRAHMEAASHYAHREPAPDVV